MASLLGSVGLCGCYQSMNMSFLQLVNTKCSVACRTSAADRVASWVLVERTKKINVADIQKVYHKNKASYKM